MTDRQILTLTGLGSLALIAASLKLQTLVNTSHEAHKLLRWYLYGR